MQKAYRNRKGFTLVEILIVVIILGILAAIVIPQFTSASSDARQSSLTSQLQTLRSQVVFSDHSLVTDAVFGEMHLISCRNVLIYFDRTLQDRAVGLFRDSLARKGFLGLGSKESLRFSQHATAFSEFARDEKIYQRRDP